MPTVNVKVLKADGGEVNCSFDTDLLTVQDFVDILSKAYTQKSLFSFEMELSKLEICFKLINETPPLEEEKLKEMFSRENRGVVIPLVEFDSFGQFMQYIEISRTGTSLAKVRFRLPSSLM